MAYTFGDQLSFISRLLGDSNTGSSSLWPLAERKSEINQAEKQFARDTKMLMENETGTIASMEIVVPSGWLETAALYITTSGTKNLITNRREISVKNLERWNDYAGSIPYYYFWRFTSQRKIKLLGASGDINGAAYDLYYFVKPTTDLSDNSDTSVFPEEYRQAPVYKAASNLMFGIGQYKKANVMLQHYDRLVSQGRDEARKWWIDFEMPVPDIGLIEADPVDRQGMGY